MRIVNDRHDRVPDPAALDELSRAFDDEPEVVEPPDVPEELVIVEQLPHDPPPPADEPPTIVRIDDYSGSVEVRPADEPHAEPAAPAEPAEPADAVVPDRASGEEPVEDVVVIAIDDDLPDPVYVEGSLERDSGRSIVFIEDDDTGDAVAPDADAQRGIEPRMRERRVAVKRAQSRKRLKWVALGVAVVLVGVGALALLGSPLL